MMLKKHFLFLSSCLAIATIATISNTIQPAVARPTAPVLMASADQVEKLIESANQKAGKDDYKGAIADLTAAIKLAPNRSDLYEFRATYRSAAQDLPGALADHDQTIKLEPKNGYYFYSRSGTRRVAGDEKGSAADLGKALELLPADEPSRGNLHSLRGYSYQQLGEHQKAIADYDMAIKLTPSEFHSGEYRARADSYIALGNKAAAIKDLKAAIELYKKQGSDYDSLRTEAMEELAKLK
jgi:tetratricopeptide (TPR) repeat protein